MGQFTSYQDGKYGGFGICNMNSWTSILSTAPLLPHDVLRNIARQAGCHVYTDFTGNTYQCENYFGIYFHESGKCKIKFPKKANISEVWTNDLFGQKVDEIEIMAEKNKAFLFKYE